MDSASKYSPMYSFRIAGAKGLKLSRNLTAEFMISFVSAFLGSAMIERLPKALCPNSERPWNQAISFP